mgnify:CR=1 FL=1
MTIAVTYHSSKKQKKKGAGLATGSSFFRYSSEAVARYDWNADKYYENQQLMANDAEEISKKGDYPIELWQRPEKFSDYDYNVTCGGTDRYIGATLAIPGIPVFAAAICGPAPVDPSIPSK